MSPQPGARSCLYRGWLAHHRGGAVKNQFRYPLYAACLDLDELDDLDRRLRLFSLERPGLFSLRGVDYALAAGVTRPSQRRPPTTSLAARARARFAAAGVRPLPERILLVTQPRVLGWVFNPVSFFVGLIGGRPSAILAEINNTYDQTYAYVLDAKRRIESRRGVAFVTDKSFFVSPFIPDRARYHWELRELSDEIDIRVTVRTDGRPALAARLSGARRKLSDLELLRAFLRHPALPAQIWLRIHGQALRLRALGLQYRRPPSVS